MDLNDDILASFADDLKVKGKKPATIESYTRDAQEFLRYLQDLGLSPEAVVPETLIAYQSHLAAFDKGNSIRRKVIGTRQFFRFLSDRQGNYDSPLDHVPIPERLEQLPDQLPNKVLAKLSRLLENQTSIKSQRDLAILYLLGLEGIKASELIELAWTDWLPGPKASSLRIRGTRSRTIVLQSETSRALQKYHAKVQQLMKKSSRSFSHMLLAFKGRDAGTILNHMTRHGLKFLLYELGEAVGLSNLNTELLRHYAVQYQLSMGRSPETIMNHLGLRRLGNIAKHQHLLNKKQQNLHS